MQETTTTEKPAGLFEKSSRLFIPGLSRATVTRQPVIHFGLCLMMTVVAYAFIFCVPILTVMLPLVFPDVYRLSATAGSIIPFVVLLSLQLLGIMVGATLYRLKFTPPQGPELRRERYPQLYQVIDDVKAHYQTPFLNIDRVVLCDSFEISLVRTPCTGLPTRFTHTLLLGLPVLQTMNMTAFNALLARELSRAGMRHVYIAGWLVSLLPVWKQYVRATAKAGWYAWPLHVFFRIYVRLYQSLTVDLQKKVMLRAEHDVLDLVNDRDFLEVLTAETVIREFINKRYWPKVRKTALQANGNAVMPHARMTNVVRRFTHGEYYARMIEKAFVQADSANACFASLEQRIQNIGHHKPVTPVPLTTTAAEHYLGPALPSVISVMDRKWQLGLNQILRRHSGFHAQISSQSMAVT